MILKGPRAEVDLRFSLFLAESDHRIQNARHVAERDTFGSQVSSLLEFQVHWDPYQGILHFS